MKTKKGFHTDCTVNPKNVVEFYAKLDVKTKKRDVFSRTIRLIPKIYLNFLRQIQKPEI